MMSKTYNKSYINVKYDNKDCVQHFKALNFNESPLVNLKNHFTSLR